MPGETKETIQETLDFAKEINPHTIQVSLAAPYPGTFLYKQAKENGWFDNEDDRSADAGRHADRAAQLPASEPHRDFRFGRGLLQEVLFPPSKIASIVGEMMPAPQMMKRRLREGVEFFRFLRTRRDTA